MTPHPTAGGPASPTGGGGGSADEAPVCGLCHEDCEEGVAAGCGHAFCRACILDYVETAAVKQVRWGVEKACIGMLVS